jgi:hypothetical protein
MRTVLYVLASVVLLGFAACSSDDDTVSNPAAGGPGLPSMSTMTMDLSFFGIGGMGGSASRIGDIEGLRSAAGSKTNWIEAAVRALYVQLTFYDAFEEPIGAFAAAINSIPQPQEDGSWLWTFIFVEDGNDYGIFLYGQEVDDHVDWRMEVSSNHPAFILDHFVWFDGQSQVDGSFGYWQFYNPVLTPPASARLYMAAATPGVPSVRMDWQHFGPRDHSLMLTVNEVGSPDQGDILALYESPTMSTLDYHDEDLQENHNITWYPDGSGDITVPDYNNGQTACWDTNQEDVICP